MKGLNSPISKLTNTSKQLSQKEQNLFSKIVQAKQNGNVHAAKALANELAQMRKTNTKQIAVMIHAKALSPSNSPGTAQRRATAQPCS